MGDQISSREGGDPPNNSSPVRRRRSRKLSGVEARALGELAFALYTVCAAELPSESKWNMLRAKLLAWRALYLPKGE